MMNFNNQGQQWWPRPVGTGAVDVGALCLSPAASSLVCFPRSLLGPTGQAQGPAPPLIPLITGLICQSS